MWDGIRKFKDYECPTYRQVEDFLLIGTKHVMNRQETKVKKLLEAIKSADYLIMEGFPRVEEINEFAGVKNYEQVAIENFLGPIFYLEEGVDLLELGERYGIERDLGRLYDILGIFPDAINMSGSSSSRLIYHLLIYMNIKENEAIGWQDIDRSIYLNMLTAIMKERSSDMSLFFHLGDIYKYYKARLRDHEILGPRTLEYRDALEGEKVEIVGADHLDHLEKVIRGEEVVPPKQWRNFVRDLDPRYREIIEYTENIR